MKTLKISVLLLIGTVAFANNDKYVETMQKNIKAVYTVNTIDDLQGAVNTLIRIGDAEKTKWEPFYYASFGYIMMATRVNDGAKKDSYLDLAKTVLDKAAAIQPNDSEIVALEGFIHMIRVTVDPASRGPQYSMLSMQTFGKALAINPNNPRALGLMAQMQLGTAQFFKQDASEACATARQALPLFDLPVTGFAPQWGKEMTQSVVAQCK
jgi:hypothetical protein